MLRQVLASGRVAGRVAARRMAAGTAASGAASSVAAPVALAVGLATVGFVAQSSGADDHPTEKTVVTSTPTPVEEGETPVVEEIVEEPAVVVDDAEETLAASDDEDIVEEINPTTIVETETETKAEAEAEAPVEEKVEEINPTTEAKAEAEAPAVEKKEEEKPVVQEIVPAPTTEMSLVNGQVYHYPYVIVGGGCAGHAAHKSIYAADPESGVLMITGENRGPYTRPPLSKELWDSNDEDAAALKYVDWQGKVSTCDLETIPGDVAVKTVVTGINVENKTLVTNGGAIVSYDRLLLATGGVPRTLACDVPESLMDRVSYFRNELDFEFLRDVTRKDQGSHICVVGGGFLGSELSAALANASKREGASINRVTQVVNGSGVLPDVLPRYLSSHFTKKVADQGVTVQGGNGVVAIKESGNPEKPVRVVLKDGSFVDASHTVVAIGLQPCTTLAKRAGLEIDSGNGGVMVNAELCARNSVFAAGDNASYFDVALGRRRVEHYDHAVASGTMAGKNMVADQTPGEERRSYSHQSFFWSDIGDAGFEAVGLVDSRLSTTSFWAKADSSSSPAPVAAAAPMAAAAPVAATPAADDAPTGADAADITSAVEKVKASEVPELTAPAVPMAEPSTAGPLASSRLRKGVVYYTRDNEVVGMLMWNLYGKVGRAREIIASKEKIATTAQLQRMLSLA